MRIPWGGLALMMVLGIIAVDMNFDAVVTTEPSTMLAYYRVQHTTPPPASLVIPIAIAVATLDTLYGLVVLRDVRELLFLVLGSYVLYLFLGIVKPSMEAMSGVTAEDVDEVVPMLESIRDAHIYMFPTVAGMLLVHLWTHVVLPAASRHASRKNKKTK